MESIEKQNVTDNNNTTVPTFMTNQETLSPPPTSDKSNKSNNKIPKPGKSPIYKTIVIVILIIISVISIIINIVLFIKYKKKPKCKNGYFLPEDDKSICYKCQLNNCGICQGSINSQLCISCQKNYYPELNEDGDISSCLLKPPDNSTSEPTIDPETEIPECGENCEICDNFQKKCQKCFSGYFIPDEDSLKLNCQKCTLENCEQCEGLIDSNICKKCKDNFLPVYDKNDTELIQSCEMACEIGEDDKCKVCNEKENNCMECNPFFTLIGGKCYANFTIKATYKSDSSTDPIKLFDGYYYYKFKAQMIIDDKIIDLDLNENRYDFKNKGEYTVYLILLKATVPFQNLFSGCNKLISVFIPFSREINNLNIQSFYQTFKSCTNLISVKISNINTLYLTSMHSMFLGCTSLKYIDFSNVDFSKVGNTNSMFSECSSLISVHLANFKKIEYMNYMFEYCKSLKTIELTNFNTNNVKEMKEAFLGCSSLTSLDIMTKLDLSKVRIMASTFKNCSSLISLDFSNSNVYSVENLYGSFSGCYNLKSINFTYFYTYNVNDFTSMFYNCASLISLDLSSFTLDNTKSLVNMFYNCKSLTSINLSSFETKNILNMDYMFYNCSSLLSIDVSKFNTENIYSMNNLFNGCSSLKSIDISNFNTGKIEESSSRMDYLFSNCKSLEYLDISSIKSLKYAKILVDLPDYGKIKCKKIIENEVYKKLPYWDRIIVD